MNESGRVKHERQFMLAHGLPPDLVHGLEVYYIVAKYIGTKIDVTWVRFPLDARRDG